MISFRFKMFLITPDLLHQIRAELKDIQWNHAAGNQRSIKGQRDIASDEQIKDVIHDRLEELGMFLCKFMS